MSVRLGEIITVVTSSDLMDQELCVRLSVLHFAFHVEKVGKINVSGTALGTVITIFS